VASFTPLPLYPSRKSPTYPINRRLSGPQNRSGHLRALFTNRSYLYKPLKYFIMSRGTPAYGNVHRPEKVDSREWKAVAATLFPMKFISKELVSSLLIKKTRCSVFQVEGKTLQYIFVKFCFSYRRIPSKPNYTC